MQAFQIQILTNEPKQIENIHDDVKDKIQKRYFDMVEIKDIALQLDLTEKEVKAVLDERGIEIVSQKKPFKKPFKKYWRK